MGTWVKDDVIQNEKKSLMEVRTYQDAYSATTRFFEDIDWNDIQGFAISAPPTTQEMLRRPFDVSRHLADYSLAKTAITNFMIDEPTGFRRQ